MQGFYHEFKLAIINRQSNIQFRIACLIDELNVSVTELNVWIAELNVWIDEMNVWIDELNVWIDTLIN